MTVETPVTYVNDLNASYPAEDEVGTLHEGNDHLRNIKKAIKQTFPNIAGAVLPTHTELNYVDGVTSNIQTQLTTIQTQLTTLATTLIPSGSNMLFVQTAAPTGWTKSTTHNNKALRIVSGTASSGGSVAFSTLFDRTATDAFTLTASHIPAHTHTFGANTGTESADHAHYSSGSTGNGGAHTHNYTTWAGNYLHDNPVSAPGGGNNTAVTATTTTSAEHAHSFGVWSGGRSSTHYHYVSGTTSSVGSSGSHSHGVDMRVQYVDAIIAVKD